MSRTDPDTAPWTSRRLLVWTTQHLDKRGVDHARVAAEMLLSHVLGVPRLKLYMEAERPATELERASYRELVRRAADHEPVDYLVGQAPFFSMMLRVNPTVLIPRPSTETIVEHVVQHERRTPGFHAPLVADVGTGCGAVAVAVTRHVPNCRAIATDICAEALEVAALNARTVGVEDRIDLRRGDLLEPLGEQRVRYLLSNPPYISDEHWERVEANVKNYEPHAALRGGLDGLRYLRPLISGARRRLEHPGQLVLEIADSQKEAVLRLASEAEGLTNAHVLADHEGLPRVLVADTV